MKENHILIGLGGTGGRVLKAFRKRLFQEYSEEERAKLPISFLYVDTSTEEMRPGDESWYVNGENAQFSHSEFLHLQGCDMERILDNSEQYPGLKGIIGDAEEMKRALGCIGATTGQKRRAGRILFGASIEQYIHALNNAYQRVNAITHSERNNIYIFTSLAGGTGSGAIIDAIAQTRMIPQFREGHSIASLTGTSIMVNAMLPEIAPKSLYDAGKYHANVYAALRELNALLTGNYTPLDVTGRHVRLELDRVTHVADGLILYSNTNEYGDQVDTRRELPQMVADHTYSRIFMEATDNTIPYLRAYYFKDMEDWRVEYYEKAENHAIVPYRTKSVSSFDIKRITIPEEEITKYLTYSLGRQALLQMTYNNWSDNSGYRDEPANKDFYMEAASADLQEKWRISDKHLMLEIPILEDEKDKFCAFAPYWASIIPKMATSAKSEKQPLHMLEALCEMAFCEQFRGCGAKQFYEYKTAASDSHAKEIRNRIEHYIFEQWEDGDLSLYDMLQLLDCISAEIGKKSQEMVTLAQTAHKQVDQLIQQKDINKKDFSEALIQLLVKGKYLTKHSYIMQNLMSKRCEILGAEFAQQLLAKVSTLLNNLRGDIEQFIATLTEAIQYHNEVIATNSLEDDEDTNYRQKEVVRIYDQKRIQDFIEQVIKDKKRQKKLAATVRLRIRDAMGSDATFSHANAIIDLDWLKELMETVVRQKTIYIHDDILVFNHDKLIHRNILEVLREKYTDEESLQTFANKMMENCGVLVQLNEAELHRSVGGENNPTPQQGFNINRKTVLVNLPKVEGNERVNRFAQRLKAALQNTATPGIELYVDTNGSHPNEMTVQKLTYLFPIRCMENLAFYKNRYESLINHPESELIKLTLYGEGTGEGLPSLEIQ